MSSQRFDLVYSNRLLVAYLSCSAVKQGGCTTVKFIYLLLIVIISDDELDKVVEGVIRTN